MNAREPVLEVFADVSSRPVESPQAYLDGIEAVYVHDAYNSLSIEGYRVTPALIERNLISSRPTHSAQFVQRTMKSPDPGNDTGMVGLVRR